MTLPLWSILFIILIPNLLATITMIQKRKNFDAYDYSYPRQQAEKLTGFGARAWAAQQNSWEALIVYAPAVIIAHIVGADPIQSFYAAILFCIARVFYSICYLFNWAKLRSFVYFIAFASCMWLFWLAGNAN